MSTYHDRPFSTLDNMTIKEMLAPALEEYNLSDFRMGKINNKKSIKLIAEQPFEKKTYRLRVLENNVKKLEKLFSPLNNENSNLKSNIIALK